MKRLSMFIGLAVLATAALTCFTKPASAAELGVNLGGISDWDPGGQMFTDVMKNSRHFGSLGNPSDQAASVDANGWPTTDAATVMLIPPTNVSGYNTGGTYKLTFNGSATLQNAGGTTPSFQNQVYNSGTNTTTCDVVMPSGLSNIFLGFANTKRTSSSGTNTGITNMRLIRPGYPADGSQLFTNEFINSLQYFTCLRAMDYLSTNGNTVTNFANWHKTTSATQQVDNSGSGGCYEYLVQLANQTGKDVWINFPIGADDNFITQVATIFHNTLNAGRHVYLENSNEVWNSQFAQFTTNLNAANSEVAGGGSNLTWNGNSDQYRYAARRYARRIEQISLIWKGVYGASGFGNTYRPMYCWQQASPYFTGDAMDYLTANYGAPSGYLWGDCHAPYMTVPDGNTGSVASILAGFTSATDTSCKPNNQSLRTEANTYGLHECTYEGGPSLWGNVNLQIEINANRDPGITSILYHDVHDNFWGVGGELYMYFDLCTVYGSSGMWGLTENLANITTPKFSAMQQLAASLGGGSIPPVPTGLTATAGNMQVALNWSTSSGATAYDVKRSTVSGSGYVTVSSPATTSYTNTGLTNGTTYYFVVDAKNANGTSGNSSQVSATPSAGSSGLVKINCGGAAAAPFIADTGFSGGTAATYTGTIDTSGVTNPAPQAVYLSERYGTETYTMGGLTSGTTYQVRLHFCENYWTAAGARTFNVALNGTTVLSNFDIFATTGAIRKANVQQFNVAANGSGQIVVALTTVVNNATINGIEVNAAAAPPPVPTGLAATPGNAQVALTWNASTGATAYDVKRSTVSGSGYATVSSPTATNYTNTGLTNGTTYYFVVDAKNANGTSANSSQVSAIPTAGGSGNTHGGTWALKCVKTSTPAWKNCFQEMTVPSNTAYVASFWLKGTGSIVFRVDAGDFGTPIVNQTFTATSIWTQCSASFNTGANTSLTYTIIDGGTVAGTFYMDDCFMGVSGGANVVPNPGFESGNTLWAIDAGSPFTIVQNP